MRPKTYDDELRARLVQGAAEAIALGGVDAVSLRALATGANTSTNAIYTLFENRDGLVSAVLAEAAASFTAAQRAVPATSDVLADLLELGRAYRRWALANPALYAVMFGGRAETVACEQVPPDESLEAMGALIDVVARGASAGAFDVDDVAMTATLIWAGVHGFVSLENAQWSGAPLAERDALYEQQLRAITAPWVRSAMGSRGDDRRSFFSGFPPSSSMV